MLRILRSESDTGNPHSADGSLADQMRSANVGWMGENESRRTFAIWGHVHGANLGDELVFSVIVDAIRRRQTTRIVGITLDPDDTRVRHGIDEGFPINPGASGYRKANTVESSRGSLERVKSLIRRVPGARVARGAFELPLRVGREIVFCWRSFRLLRGIDMVVVAGSGQLLDKWLGARGHPYTTFRWAMLCRLAHTPMYYPSVGAGPISGRISAFLIRSALQSAAYVSVRDLNSGRALKAIGVHEPPRCPDMAFGFALPDPVNEDGRNQRANPIVGVNVMAYSDPRYWPRGVSEEYESYVRTMGAFVSGLLDDGYRVRLFSSQTRADALVENDLVTELDRRGQANSPELESALPATTDIGDLVRAVSTCDFVVAARYHSIILPLLLDIPVLGMAYDPKTVDLMDYVGLSAVCVDIGRVRFESLRSAWGRLLTFDAVETRRQRRSKLDAAARDVGRQFDLLFGPLRLAGDDAADSLRTRTRLEAHGARPPAPVQARMEADESRGRS